MVWPRFCGGSKSFAGAWFGQGIDHRHLPLAPSPSAIHPHLTMRPLTPRPLMPAPPPLPTLTDLHFGLGGGMVWTFFPRYGDASRFWGFLPGTLMPLGFGFCLFVVGWRPAFRRDWPFLIIHFFTVPPLGHVVRMLGG